MDQLNLRKIRGCVIVFLIVSLGCLSVGGATNKQLSVYVVNYPLKYFAERIGGDHVAVTLPVPADIDPVYWVPQIDEVGLYQRADVILLNGASLLIEPQARIETQLVAFEILI